MVDISELEKKIKEYCTKTDLYLKKEELLSVIGTMILEPELTPTKAIKKTKRMSETSWISADKEDQHGRRLVDKVAAPIIDEVIDLEGESYDTTTGNSELVDTYISAVTEKHQRFVKELFEERGDLMTDLAREVKPEQLENLVETWTKGSADKRKVKDEIEKELIVFMNRYILSKREEWLAEQIGEDNAKNILRKLPNLVPINTMERTISTLKELGISNKYFGVYKSLLYTSPQTIMKNYEQLKQFGLSEQKIISNPVLLIRNPETVKNNHEELKRMGLTDKKIAVNSWLFNSDPTSLKKRYDALISLGISSKKIASQPRFLTTTAETIERNYQRLSALGIKNKTIYSSAELLLRSPETIESNYHRLIALGLDAKIITSLPNVLEMKSETLEKNLQRLAVLGLKYNTFSMSLLLRNPDVIEQRYQGLVALGVKDHQIASHPRLLTLKPENIQKIYNVLKKVGLSEDKIRKNVSLLAFNPSTIEQNYQHHISLLGDDKDNNSGGEKILKQPQLLAISPRTLQANIQFLYDQGIHYNNGVLATTTQLKRKKIAWILKEVFEYRTVSDDEKKEKIRQMYHFVGDKSYLLNASLKSLEQQKDNLKKLAIEYIV